jgi:hypothetical protein
MARQQRILIFLSFFPLSLSEEKFDDSMTKNTRIVHTGCELFFEENQKSQSGSVGGREEGLWRGCRPS